MAHLTPVFGTQSGLAYTPAPRLLRWGSREITVCRDFRKRFYRVNPLVDCRAGVAPGHLEVLFCRKWLVILSGVQ